MQTLTYGLKLPESGDEGTTLFDALEDNITQLDGHTHNGVNSPSLTAASIVGVTASISSGSWAAYGGPTGFYRQTVTLPAGFSFDTVSITIRESVTGSPIFPTIEKVSATQYRVYTTNNTLSFTACYGG